MPMQVETVKIANPKKPGEYLVVNKDSVDKNKDILWEDYLRAKDFEIKELEKKVVVKIKEEVKNEEKGQKEEVLKASDATEDHKAFEAMTAMELRDYAKSKFGVSLRSVVKQGMIMEIGKLQKLQADAE